MAPCTETVSDFALKADNDTPKPRRGSIIKVIELDLNTRKLSPMLEACHQKNFDPPSRIVSQCLHTSMMALSTAQRYLTQAMFKGSWLL